MKLELCGTIKDRPGPGHSPSAGSLNGEYGEITPAQPSLTSFHEWEPELSCAIIRSNVQKHELE